MAVVKRGHSRLQPCNSSNSLLRDSGRDRNHVLRHVRHLESSCLSAGNPTAANQRFINSEMWLAQSTNSSAPWVETGIKNGFFAGAPGVGNRAFAEWNRSGVVGFHSFGGITLDDAVTDEFQISRAGTTYSWNVYFDGQLWTTGTSPGFWSSVNQQLGAEVASAYATSSLFTMYGKGITSSGAKANLATDVAWPANDTAAGSGPADLYGQRPSESTWKWRVPE
ncbi:hypothetical protein [Nocardioides marmorisolisilvae]|uniref:hypothetical protein n=1 Tax=Nocardioides marmorisolisilvae TaxID=1542737 RepID=UPI0011CDC3F8|nr:hypothetical protein [Nocardioides marmorisolisilvae]